MRNIFYCNDPGTLPLAGFVRPCSTDPGTGGPL